MITMNDMLAKCVCSLVKENAIVMISAPIAMISALIKAMCISMTSGHAHYMSALMIDMHIAMISALIIAMCIVQINT